jgi:hypothetical protein
MSNTVFAITYSGGSGTLEDPFRISTIVDWQQLIVTYADWDKCFILEANIDLTGYSITPVGDFIHGIFTGVFEGNGHSVSNATINLPGQNYVGLFGYLGHPGEIRNLRVENVDVSGNNPVGGLVGCMAYTHAVVNNVEVSGSVKGGGGSMGAVGGLCGVNESGTVRNSFSTAVVNGNYAAGGLCGENIRGSIIDCHASGDVIGTWEVGGLCGRNSEGTITNVYATGLVTGSVFVGGLCGWNNRTIDAGFGGGNVNGISDVGGLCGGNDTGGILSNCYSTGSVNGTDYVGGCVGINIARIEGSYATGTVTATGNFSGGLCGRNYFGTIANSYSMGPVMGNTAGGVCGINENGTVTMCYSISSVGGTGRIGGLCGLNAEGMIRNCFWNRDTAGLLTSDGGWSLSDIQMKQSASYIGWNNGLWTINEGNDYPRLSWQNVTGNPITTDFPARTYVGSGSDVDPFQIQSAADLICMGFREPDWDQSFLMKTNIEMSGVSTYRPADRFIGRFEGQGYSIRNLTIDASVLGNRSQLGLFAHIGENGSVKNLNLEDIKVIGDNYSIYLGGLCGSIGDSEYKGGLVSNCFIKGSVVSGNDCVRVGGLSGYNNFSTITECSSDVMVLSGDKSSMIGGLCGLNYKGTIQNSYSLGTVAGGDASEFVGGFVGWNDQAKITYSYSTGKTIGSFNVGGFCGHMSTGYISEDKANFWDIQTSEKTKSDMGKGMTTSQMKISSTFVNAGWDLINVWDIGENQTYPFLRTYLASDLNKDKTVNLLDLSIVSEQWLQE